MNIWGLPKTAKIGGAEYVINTDFRDVLEIISYLNDETRPEYLRWQIAIALFYEGTIPDVHQTEAVKFLIDFIEYGAKETRPGPKLLDWEQDAPMIIGDINKVAGREVREATYLHWWTFLSYFYGIGEGQLSTIISIREKKRSGKKLEKWEEEYYKKNRSKVDLVKTETPEDAATRENLEKWL